MISYSARAKSVERSITTLRPLQSLSGPTPQILTPVLDRFQQGDPASLVAQLVPRVDGITNLDTNGRAQLVDQMLHWPRKRSLPEQDHRWRVVLQRQHAETAVVAFAHQNLNPVPRFDQRLLGSLPWRAHRFNLGGTRDASRWFASARQLRHWPPVGHIATVSLRLAATAL